MNEPPTSPRVAVVIPCYQDGLLLDETIGSVQESEPVELVVVDDGSEDRDTVDALKALEDRGVRVIRQQFNRGVGAARNAGLLHTSAEYVLPLDSDDLLVPGILASMADLLGAHPEAAVAYGDYQEFGEADVYRAVPDHLDGFSLLYTNRYPQTALFRRSALERVGGWDENPRTLGYEDWSLWMSLAEIGATGVHAGADKATHLQRVHGPRLLEAARKRHRATYRHLKDTHVSLFSRRDELARQSPLSPLRKRLYPYVYGGRPRSSLEPRAKAVLERIGVWRRTR